MVKTLVGVASVIAITAASAAHAADWSGLYAGIEAINTTSDVNYCLACKFDEGFYGWADPIPREAAPSGLGMGAYIGYNYQLSGGIVLGVEGAYGMPNADYADNDVFNVDAINTGYHIGITSLSSVRARAGYTSGNMMFYATAGIAWAELLMDNQEYPTSSATGTTTFLDSVHQGTVIGLGVEYAINDNVNVRAQYLMYNFSDDVITDMPSYYYDNAANLSANTLSVGLSYNF